MDELTAIPPTRSKFAPAGLLAGTAAAVIVVAMLLPSAGTAFAPAHASQLAASSGSVSGSSAPSASPSVPKVAPSTVVGWGIPSTGAKVADLSKLTGKNIVGIAGAMDSTTFLTADGKLFQATSDGVTDISSKAVHPTAISAGSYYTVALNGDGTVSAWGEGFDNPRMIPAQINGVTAIAAGSTQVLALLSDGSIATFGSQPGSQIDVPAALSSVTTNSASTPATAIAAGSSNFGAIVGGKVVAWGEDSGTPPAAMAGATIVDLKAGDRTFIALSSDGRAYSWGAPDTPNSTLPSAIASRTDIVQIASGNGHDILLTKSGKVLTFGVPGFGFVTVPKDIAPVTLIGAGRSSSWAVTGTVAAATTSTKAAPALATGASVYEAVGKWAVAAAAGDPAANALVQSSGYGLWSSHETVTGITIHYGGQDGTNTGPLDGPITTGGMTCLRVDVAGTDPADVGSSSVPWDVRVDVRNPAKSVVVWAQGYPTSAQPSC